MHRDDLIIATFREKRCSSCNKGVFRFDSALPLDHYASKRWLHRCSNKACTQTLECDEVWPQIIYRGKVFQLQQAMKHPDDGKLNPLHKWGMVGKS